jgi:hypothetical protein
MDRHQGTYVTDVSGSVVTLSASPPSSAPLAMGSLQERITSRVPHRKTLIHQMVYSRAPFHNVLLALSYLLLL